MLAFATPRDITAPGVQSIVQADKVENAPGHCNLGPGVDALATVGYIDYKGQRKGTMGVSDAGYAAMTGLSLTF